ncbi:MAG TPA: glycosyltransferase family 2 protein, partial [Planctomycetota bacterium]|nr:glycosyltransferase family 2 protein [Planctomycetota bacterium]
MNYLSACCIAKQEHAYLEEWIDYHLRVGVEHFFIYDDGDPGDQPLAELLAGHVARGTVEVRRAPAGARKQM